MNIDTLLKQAKKMQDQLSKITEELATKEVEASSGGAMVTVKANGKSEITKITIDPEAFSLGDKQMLEDMILAAANEALNRAKELSTEAFKQVSGGINIPGFPL
ncbi:MAG: YbaB/EbfC family nucleoid-associated protein [Deltaproteobacteria bacterium]|nr:YbaB/EbfC family nucleoid-associated protein [Deltaproteobacteria bacterium]MCL5793161.1 YbaB/EbfC family nucleoid-associated protein [Deltaproteobacteria bacterium]